MKPGDLIRYNVGGSRMKTLAMVLDIELGHEPTSDYGRWDAAMRGYLTQQDRGTVTVQWLQTDGDYLPRKVASEMVSANFSRPTPGEICAHPLGAWFEVTNESR